MKTPILLCCGILLAATAIANARSIPTPLPNHPGNVFTTGETVVISLSDSAPWRLTDYSGRTITEGSGDKASLGKLPTGYYELHRVADGKTQARITTVGVIEPLRAPTPITSPIGIDVAMAWFYTGEQRAQAANLCTLAGVNWVRDRLRWNEMEPSKGRFAPETKYDDTARIQSRAGLRVLQVHHNTPMWATKTPQRQPPDLRDAYNFMREMAHRWKGEVLAFEPWNEGDVDTFGGHIGVEMASLQKASYLGLKAGNPNVIACLNVFALVQPNMLKDLEANKTWPYFDTFNFHHYCGPDNYTNVYAAFRPFTAGKPMWVTEFNYPVHFGKNADQEPSADDLKIQTERLVQVITSSLNQGPQAAFYFMLPHYCEGDIQFGILHKDLTPRPAYVAMAAVGRFLADASPLGRMQAAANARAFVFAARPDGKMRNVVVAWTTEGESTLEFPTVPIASFDLLGRTIATPTSDTVQITKSPAFFVFKKKDVPPHLTPAATNTPSLKKDKPSPIVFQVLTTEGKTSLPLSSVQISIDKPETLNVFAYNFGKRTFKGHLTTTAPQNWSVKFPEELEIAPGERKELALTIDCHSGSSSPVETIQIQGDFPGHPVLSIRVSPTPFKLRDGVVMPLPAANNSNRWHPNTSSGTENLVTNANGGVLVKAKLNAGDRWVYPILNLEKSERPTADFDALVVTLTAQEGEANYRVIMDEENGSSYSIDFLPTPKPGETVEAVAVLSCGVHGQGWSKPDDNAKLDADKIKSLKIGCNPKGDSVKFTFKNLRWIKIKN